MSGDFGPDRYRGLIGEFLSRGYKVRGFAEAEPGRRDLILRHDIDMSLDAALPMAEIERDLGVAASYFVLLRSELYNPYSGAGLAAVNRLAALGHEIGLHLDASLYDDDPAALQAAAERECAVLERLVERPVTTISLHRPARSLRGMADPLAGRRHAYQPRYFEDMGYCSDSRGAWHHGQPLEHPAVAEGRALQLLTHPIWWQGPPAEPKDRLDRFVEARLDMVDKELAAHCEVHVAGRLRLGAER